MSMPELKVYCEKPTVIPRMWDGHVILYRRNTGSAETTELVVACRHADGAMVEAAQLLTLTPEGVHLTTFVDPKLGFPLDKHGRLEVL